MVGRQPQDYTISPPFSSAPASPAAVTERKVSVFAGLDSPRPKGLAITAAEWLGRIRGGHYSEFVAKVRAARGSPDYDKLRMHLDAVTYAGIFQVGRTKWDTPVPSSGFVFLDWDQKGEVPDVVLRDATKERLSQQPGVVAVYESVGGYGLHVIAAVAPEPRTSAEYSYIWTILTNVLDLPPGGDEKVKTHYKAGAGQLRSRPAYQPRHGPISLDCCGCAV